MPAVRYSLHYEDYSEHLISRFGKLLQMQSLVDMTLMCSSHTLRVHKAVLAASSSYFQDILQKQSNEEHSEIIIILKMRFSVLKSLVEFMYCGRTNCLEENIDELVSAAQFLKIKGLSKVSKEGLGNTNRDELPEFTPPVVIKRPLTTRSTQNASVRIDASPTTESNQASLTSGRVPGDIFPNGKDTVVRIPIDIQNAATGVGVQQNRELLGVNGMGQQLTMNSEIPPKTLRPRRGRPSMRQRQMTETCDGVLERAAERALRRREEDSRQAIRHLQDMQIRDYMDRITLTQAVESICGPGSHQSQQEPYLSLDSDLMYIPQNLNTKDGFVTEDSHSMNKEPNQPKVAHNSSQEQTGLSSAMSQYVNILKNAGLPTDLPILFESGDGSYINVNERVLLDMVQSSEIQYEVIEQPNIIERVIDPAETKSIDDLSKCIERGESLGSKDCGRSPSLNIGKSNDTEYDHANDTCISDDMFFNRDSGERNNCNSLQVTKHNSDNFRQCDESSACNIPEDMFYTEKDDLGSRLNKMSKPSDLELESVSDVHALDAEMRYFTNDAMNDDVKKYYEEQRLGDPEIMAKICSSNLDMSSSMDMPLIDSRDSVDCGDSLAFEKDDLGKNVDCYEFNLRESVGTENLHGKTLDCLISSGTPVQNVESVEENTNVDIEACRDCPTSIMKECENSLVDVGTEVLDKPLNVAVVFEPGNDKQKEFRQIRRISILPAKLNESMSDKISPEEETATVLNDMPSLLMDDCETEKTPTEDDSTKSLEAVDANCDKLEGPIGKIQLTCAKSPCVNIPFAVGLLPLKEKISKSDSNSHRKLLEDGLELRLPMKRNNQDNQLPEENEMKKIRNSLD